MKQKFKATILVTDDEPSYRDMISSVLEDAEYEVLKADSGVKALEIAKKRAVDVAVLDMMMPKMNGRELMTKLHAILPDLEVIFLTAYGSIPSAVETVKEGAADYLTKPLAHVDDLVRTVERVLQLSHFKRQRRMAVETEKNAEPFLCACPKMKEVLAVAGRVAPTDMTVLITGESGTGKERMAKHIHLNSKVAQSEMVSVNCAAIVGSLIESELFGHEKGAFTGATDRRKGRFELASNSTLFLDEIGEMPLDMQPKLLRAIQEREFNRVGGSQVLKFNGRLIAATNKILKEQCSKGLFREDLFYRLSVFTIDIPPLRERPEDIKLYIDQFVKDSAARFEKNVPVVSKSAEQILCSYSWPGNVRELANVIEASVLLCNGKTLMPEHLHGLPAQKDSNSPEKANLLVDAEKKALTEALEMFDGNREKTAKYLDMSRRNLIYKLKKHGLTGK